MSNAGYSMLAKQNADLVPSLRKYKKRKQFNRWEKGAITKAANKVARHGSHKTLFPITKRQEKAIKNKDLIVHQGIRGVRVNNPNETTRIHIKLGELIIEQDGRTWRTASIEPSEIQIMGTIESIFQQREPVAMAMLTTNGRTGISCPTAGEMIASIIGWIEEYEDFDEWFIGVTWFEEQF